MSCSPEAADAVLAAFRGAGFAQAARIGTMAGAAAAPGIRFTGTA